MLSHAEIALRLVLATGLGSVLGIEREWRKKSAGLRTHMLVALGSCCFGLVAFGVAEASVASGPTDPLRVDPLRVVQAVCGGIGFLGAGAILQGRGSVSGLTTAGSLWTAGALGLAASSGEFFLAIAATVLGLGVLWALRAIDRAVHGRTDQGPDEPEAP
jgi:putative Mg2+ transporter-C (MgtC) family protein